MALQVGTTNVFTKGPQVKNGQILTGLPCPASCLDRACDGYVGEGGASLPYLQGRTARGSAISAAQLRKQPLLEGFVSESIAR